jgi:hypothetical protein
MAHLVHQTRATHDRLLADRFNKNSPLKLTQVLDPMEVRILIGPKTPNAKGPIGTSTYS